MKSNKWLLIGTILLLVLVVGPFLIPVDTAGEIEDPRNLADPDSRFVPVSGLNVHYKQVGEGNPVFVLLHGFGASTYTWRSVADELSQVGTVIAYDRPAFGLTERPLVWEGENPYSPDAQVEIVLGLMDALEVEDAILVGNSAGGTVALNTALSAPARVSGLILVDAAVYSGGGSPAWVRPLLSTPQLDHLGPLLARRISNRGDQFIRNSWHRPDRIPEEVFINYRKPLQVQNWDRALWELTKSSYPLNLDQRLTELSVPALVITGDDDRIVPTADSIRLAAEIPDADLVVIENCGHLPQEECPVDFLEAVLSFVSDTP
jgi:pimeloyl-ACP methyl ester carboxylesterase